MNMSFDSALEGSEILFVASVLRNGKVSFPFLIRLVALSGKEETHTALVLQIADFEKVYL